ncbi:MAG TPA: hypothetical protein VF043_39075 [Ktedonobacteraceae bacterium]
MLLTERDSSLLRFSTELRRRQGGLLSERPRLRRGDKYRGWFIDRGLPGVVAGLGHGGQHGASIALNSLAFRTGDALFRSDRYDG